jgi:hypothetical protein
MNGIVIQNQDAHISKIVLNQAELYAIEMQAGFAALFAQQHLAINLGET